MKEIGRREGDTEGKRDRERDGERADREKYSQTRNSIYIERE